MSRTLDYIDARMMAKAIARWRVAGDLSDEELSEDTLAARYLNRRIAEQTEVFVPDAVAAIKALGAEPAFTSEAVKQRDNLAALIRQIAYRHNKGLSLDAKLVAALEYLTREDLMGSPLRDDESALPSQADAALGNGTKQAVADGAIDALE